MIQLHNLQAQYQSLKKEIDEAVQTVFSNSKYSDNTSIQKFERHFAKYLQGKYCIGVGNKKEAFITALHALNLPTGSEIIIPNNTNESLSNIIIHYGYKIIYCNCEKEYNTIDIKNIHSIITSNTSAILAIHSYGYSCEMNTLLKIANKYKLKIIEDCSQAIGTKYKNKAVGTIGDIGIFEFSPETILGTYGQGGAIVTNNLHLAKQCQAIIEPNDIKNKKTHQLQSRLDNLEAAILDIKLNHLNFWIKSRQTNADFYFQQLQNIPEIILPAQSPWTKPAYHCFIIKTKKRNSLQKYLHAYGIQTIIPFNQTDKEELGLPIGEHLSTDELQIIVRTIINFSQRKGGQIPNKITTLFPRYLIIKNYNSKEFIKNCLKTAPDADTTILFKNYLNLLTNQPIKFPAVYWRKKEKCEPLRVSIFCTRFNDRVHRLAISAKKNGTKLQLLYNDLNSSTQIPKEINKDLFESIINVGYPFSNIEKINAEMINFGSDIVHCHACESQSDTIFPFVFAAKIPTVVDYYDLLHAVMTSFPWMPRYVFDASLFFEKYAFTNADGRCMRSKYINLPDVKPLWKIKTPLAHIQDPVITSFINYKTYNPDKPLQIAIDGVCSELEIMATNLEKWIQNINTYLPNAQIHIYRFEKRIQHFSTKYKNIKLYNTFPRKEFYDFMKTKDILINTATTDLVQEQCCKTNAIPHHGQNSVISGIENNCITMLPQYRTDMNNILNIANRGYSYTEKDITSPIFWKTLPQKIKTLQQMPLNLTGISEQDIGQKLIQLYKETINYAISRRKIIKL